MKEKIFLVFLSLSSFCAHGAKISVPDHLNALRKKHKVTGISIAIIKDRKISESYQSGLAAPNTPVSEETLFQAASIAKPMTALATISLFRVKKIALSTPANRLTKRWKLPNKNGGNKVKIEQLLSHTSGLSNFRFSGYALGSRIPSLVDALAGNQPFNRSATAVTTKPGSKWDYCPAGYMLLELMLEDMTGLNFADWMEKQLLKPLNMTDASFHWPQKGERMTRLSQSYFDPTAMIPGAPYAYVSKASGGVWITAKSLANFAIGVQKLYQGKTLGPLTKEDAQTLLQPIKQKSDAGHGMEVSKDKYGKFAKNGQYFSHGGFNVGFLAYLIADTDGKHGLVILLNTAPHMDAKEVPQWSLIPELNKFIAERNRWH